MAKKLGWLGERVCLLCAVLFCAVIVMQSALTAWRGSPGVTALGALCAVAVLVAAVKFWPFGDRATAVALFVLRFVLVMAMVLIVNAQPIQDFNTMYTAAQDMAQGSKAYLDNIYFFNWAYQTGFSFYESLILRVFGPSQFSLQVMNAVWIGGIGALVYLIAIRLLPRKAALAVSALYAVYPAPLFLAAVLTNQHIATFFFYLAVWLLVRREELSPVHAALVGAIIALGNVMRPIGIILVLAALCWRGIRLLLGREENWKRALSVLVLLVVGYEASFALMSGAVVWSGLNPEGLGNNRPMWKFVLGFNQESNGTWNQADYDVYMSLPTEEANDAMREVVLERLRVGPVQLAKLAVRKSQAMWGANEYMYFGFGHLDAGKVIGPMNINQYTQVLARGDKGVYQVVFVLALIGVISLLRRGTNGGPLLLFTFLFCGYYAVHLIVEVQSRYRYFAMPAVFILAGVGLSAILERRKKG